MNFSRDCRRGLVVPTPGSPVLVSSCTLSTLRFCAQWLLGLLRPRPAGQPLAVVSATLRLLARIAMDNGMYVCLFRLRAPTVGAGAKKQITRKSLFLEIPSRLN